MPSELGGAGKGAVGGLATGAAIGSVIPGIGTAIGAVAGAVIGGVSGWLNARKARRKMAEANALAAVPEDVLQTQRMAQNLAKEGLPSAQYRQAERNINRNQAEAINASQDRRGGLMTIGRINRQTNDAMLNLDAENARQRRANIQYLGQVNNIVGAYKQRRTDRDWNYAMQLMGAVNQNQEEGMQQGLNTIYSLGKSGAFNFNGRGSAMGAAPAMAMVDRPVESTFGRSPVVGGEYINPNAGYIGNRYSYLGG